MLPVSNDPKSVGSLPPFDLHLPFCRQLAESLQRRDSIIVHLPRASGQGLALRYLSRAIIPALGFDHAMISVGDYMRDGDFDYGEAIRALGDAPIKRGREPKDFRRLFSDLVRKKASSAKEAFVVAINVSGPDYAEAAFEVVSDVHKVLGEVAIASSSGLICVVVDDYSLYFYEQWRTMRNSRWDLFEREYYTCFSREELQDFVSTLSTDRLAAGFSEKEMPVEEIYDLTGGHYGLLIEVISTFVGRSKFTIESARRELFKSDAVHLLKAALEEDGARITARALSFAERKPVPADEKALDQFLRRSGLLRAASQLTFVLIDGILREILEEYAEETSKTAKAMIGAPSGLLSRVDSAPAATANGLVILHLSDLHLGDDFRFTYPGSVLRGSPDRLNLVDAIAEDIRKLGLAGLVDGLVISGDFSVRASMAEFLRARDFVVALLDAVGLDKTQLLVTGGNHDVEWDPPLTGKRDSGSAVSRENLEAFFELLGQSSESSVRYLDVFSRDRTTHMRMIALDSNYVEGKDAGGIGYVSAKSLDRAKMMQRDSRPHETSEKILHQYLWLVTHHHVFPVLDAEPDKARLGRVTIMASSATLLRAANEMGVEVILHGHEHQPCITAAARWSSREEIDCKPIAVIGAGSIGAPVSSLGPFARNHYYILQRDQTGMYVRSRMIGDTGLGFVTHADIYVGL